MNILLVACGIFLLAPSFVHANMIVMPPLLSDFVPSETLIIIILASETLILFAALQKIFKQKLSLAKSFLIVIAANAVSAFAGIFMYSFMPSPIWVYLGARFIGSTLVEGVVLQLLLSTYNVSGKAAWISSFLCNITSYGIIALIIANVIQQKQALFQILHPY